MKWRNQAAWIQDGFNFSTSCDEALQLYDEILFDFFTGRPTPKFKADSSNGLLEHLTKTFPNFMMGKVLRFFKMSDHSVVSDIKSCLEKNECTEWERMHYKGVVAFSKGENVQACDIWTKILMLHPKDLLALTMPCFTHFFLGNSTILRNIIARSLPHFDESSECYGYLLNRLAFGLEETHQFDEADKYANKGLSLVPNDCWGFHAKAHIYEFQCKYKEGIEFLETTESLWKNQFLACHLYWHVCLFCVELGDFSKAFEIYDTKMKALIARDKSYLGTVDGVQLLYRLEFNNLTVGKRWEDVFFYASKELALKHPSSSYVLHVLLSFLRSADARNKLDNFFSHFDSFLKNELCTYNAHVMKDVVYPIYEAYKAHQDKDYESAVEKMLSVKEKLLLLGGSNSQRDFFELFLIDSCKCCKRGSKERIWGVQLLNERLFLKQKSPMTIRLMDEMQKE